MAPPITNAQKFAFWFNMTHPDAYRQITAEDVEDLKSCELIYRYGFCSTSLDGKIVMSILRYEQMKERIGQSDLLTLWIERSIVHNQKGR